MINSRSIKVTLVSDILRIMDCTPKQKCMCKL